MRNPDWLVPVWPAPPHVKSLCTTRAGGQSQPPYDTLNLGDHVGDRLQDVSANREVLQLALGVQPVFLSQVHGLQVLALDYQTPQGSEADACLTARLSAGTFYQPAGQPGGRRPCRLARLGRAGRLRRTGSCS